MKTPHELAQENEELKLRLALTSREKELLDEKLEQVIRSHDSILLEFKKLEQKCQAQLEQAPAV